MPQSLGMVVIHLVFSTKDRRPILIDEFRGALHAYLAGIARDLACECPRVGGTADHVHLAIKLSRTLTIARLVERLKVSSTRWIHENHDRHFAWQRGYGCFSINPAKLPLLVEYIGNQEAHHQTRTFEDEYRTLAKKFGLALDERYAWD